MSIGSPCPELIDPKRMRHIVEQLRSLKYTHAEIRRRLGIADHLQNKTPRLATRLGEIAAARAAMMPGDAVEALMQVLFLNNSVPKTVLEKYLNSHEISALEDMRLIQVEGDLVGRISRCQSGTGSTAS